MDLLENVIPQWLAWVREIQALCQTGLAFSNTAYDSQRYHRLMEIGAEIAARYSGLPSGDLLGNFLVQPGYATPKIDVRGAVVREGRILLVQERTDSRWCMPGGWADVGAYDAIITTTRNEKESREYEQRAARSGGLMA